MRGIYQISQRKLELVLSHGVFEMRGTLFTHISISPSDFLASWIPQDYMTKRFHEQINLGNAPSSGEIMPWSSLSVVMALHVFLFGVDWLWGAGGLCCHHGVPPLLARWRPVLVHCGDSVVMSSLSEVEASVVLTLSYRLKSYQQIKWYFGLSLMSYSYFFIYPFIQNIKWGGNTIYFWYP